MHYFERLNLTYRLLPLVVVLALSLCLLLAVHLYYEAKLAPIEQQVHSLKTYHKQLSLLEFKILEARLYDVHLSNHKNPRFYQKFSERMEEIDGISEYLSQRHRHLRQVQGELHLFRRSLDKYKQSVAKVLKVQDKIGFHKQSGILQALSQQKTVLDERLVSLGHVSLQVVFTQVQLLEQEFSNSLNMKQARAILKRLDSLPETLVSLPLAPDVRQSLTTHFANYRTLVEEFMRTVVPLELSVAEGRLHFGRLVPHLQSMLKNVEQYQHHVDIYLQSRAERGRTYKIAVLVLFVATLVIFLVIQILSAQSLSRRLSSLNEAMREMSDGHYQNMQKSLPLGQDEVGRLAESFYNLSAQLQTQWAVITEEQANLAAEQARTRFWQHAVLPPSIAAQLRHQQKQGQGNAVIAQTLPAVSILVCRIVDFEHILQQLDPESSISLLNDIFSSFDDLAQKQGLSKTRTVGDSYILIAGAPEACPQHARKVGRLALAMQGYIKKLSLDSAYHLKIRIGLHLGDLVGGVIQGEKCVYDFWGEDLRYTHHLEHSAVMGNIQCSENFYETTKDHFEFMFESNAEGVGLAGGYILRTP